MILQSIMTSIDKLNNELISKLLHERAAASKDASPVTEYTLEELTRELGIPHETIEMSNAMNRRIDQCTRAMSAKSSLVSINCNTDSDLAESLRSDVMDHARSAYQNGLAFSKLRLAMIDDGAQSEFHSKHDLLSMKDPLVRAVADAKQNPRVIARDQEDFDSPLGDAREGDMDADIIMSVEPQMSDAKYATTGLIPSRLDDLGWGFGIGNAIDGDLRLYANASDPNFVPPASRHLCNLIAHGALDPVITCEDYQEVVNLEAEFMSRIGDNIASSRGSAKHTLVEAADTKANSPYIVSLGEHLVEYDHLHSMVAALDKSRSVYWTRMVDDYRFATAAEQDLEELEPLEPTDDPGSQRSAKSLILMRGDPQSYAQQSADMRSQEIQSMGLLGEAK